METSPSTAATTDLSAIVAALVPAITKGVVETLQSMGVILAKDTTVQEAGNNSEQQSPSTANLETSQQLSVNPQPSASPLMATIDNGEDSSNGAIEKRPSIHRPFCLGVDTKTKAKIWADEAIDFGTLLGFKT